MSKFGSMAHRKTSPYLKILFLTLGCWGIALAPKAQVQVPPTYDEGWKQVDVLVDSLGQPRTALDLVRALYARARREHNGPQAIRALLYTVRIDSPLEENADSTSIRLLETASDSFTEPARSVLLNITAQAYWNYLRNHYQIYSRTPVAGGPGPDLDTWTAPDFHHRIDSLFSASLRDTVLLQGTSLSAYEPILQKGNSRSLRPTLYDLLVNRAIHYYASGESNTARVAKLAPDTMLFSPAREFMNHVFREADTAALAWEAVSLYQALLRFHARDAKPDAYVDADLGRLQFVHDLTSMGDADEAHIAALKHLIRQYDRQEAGASATYQLALYLDRKGLSYQAGSPDTLFRWSLNEALTLLDAVIHGFPNSFAAGNARIIEAFLRETTIQLTAEHVNLPGKPFLTLVEFKNCPQLHLRVLRATPDLMTAIDKPWPADLAKAVPLRAWTQRLPDPGDHQTHRTEIKIDPLPPGSYILLASTNDRFGLDTNAVQAVSLKVSDIGWLSTGSKNFYILHRGTGEPMAGALVQTWDIKTGKVVDYVTDKNGRFKWETGSNGQSLRSSRIQIRYGDDSLSVDDRPPSVYAHSESTNPGPRLHFLYFTDRAIYRPGQIVYFKAIGLIRDTIANSDVPYQTGRRLTFFLESLGRRLDSISLEPNEFGSVHGQFTLPAAVIGGSFQITGGGVRDQTTFSVEEYKRARYDVRFNRPAEDYQLGDTLNLKGLAMAYAGNPVGGARVTYTVTRAKHYIVRWDRTPLDPRLIESLLQDSTHTARDGSFSIRFPLKPEQGNPKAPGVAFTYSVHADVTDLNGETHSAFFSVDVGHTSLVLTLHLPSSGKVNADSLRSLSVESANLSGIPQQTRTTVTISRLSPPERLIRPRYWEAPDLFTMPEDTFHRLFPHDAYGGETDRSQWPVQERILRDTFTTGTRPALSLTGMHLHSGVYRVEVSATDPRGQVATTGGFLEVYNAAEARLPFPAYTWDLPGDQTATDSSTYFTGSSAGPRFVVQQVARSGQIHLTQLRLPGDGAVSVLHFPTVGENTHDFTFGLAFFADNRVFTRILLIPARKPAGKLSIHYTTFRDKLEPGSTERWTLSIHGPGHEAADAEVLASMYDASLDQFVPHAWSLPDLNTGGNRNILWSSYGFESVWGRLAFFDIKYRPSHEEKAYDEVLDVALPRGTVLAMGQPRMASPRAGFLATVNIPGENLVYTKVRIDGKRFNTPQPSDNEAPLPSFRTDFRETAFFYPDLHTDSTGNLAFTFTMPEALTRWSLQTLAHTRGLAFGLDQRNLVTQKTLMLQPNIPRFLREGDEAWLSTKVVSLDSVPVDGKVRLEVLDALSMQPVDKECGNLESLQSFSLAPGSSVALRFHLSIPSGFTHPLVYRLSASAGNVSDGEQGPIPVLSRRVLLTETYPLTLDGDAPRRLRIEPLLHAAPASPYRLTLEYSASPAWYVLRALPYLEGGSDACPQFVLDRYYTNTLGAGVLRAQPAARSVLEAWKRDSSARSPLDQDAGLKTALLEETPWVLDAAGETASMQRLSTFLDSDRLARGQEDALRTLADLQFLSGAFPWFNGGPENRYITGYILTRLGQLSTLDMLPSGDLPLLRPLVKKALAYLDTQIRSDYEKATSGPANGSSGPPSPENIRYLYTRSLFLDNPPDARTREALDFYLAQAKARWLQTNLYSQGMIALTCYRSGDTAAAATILTSLEQRSILSPELGRYWKENEGGWSWSQAPIETQALLISAFEAGKRRVVADQLRTWLLGQKQTHAWTTRAATADACYALLLGGSDQLTSFPEMTARLGDVTVDSRTHQAEAGTGFFREQWDGAALRPDMGNIEVRLSHKGGDRAPDAGAHRSWGAVYYQHFEDLDSVQATQTSLSIQKQLFVVPVTGSAMRSLGNGDTLHVGDRVRIRLVLRSDRSLEFVHLKDLRAACLEPVDVLSGYWIKGGLGYYFSPGDLSTSFYMDVLPKGTFVLEYDQYVNMAGTFSGGVATLQSLYAPQFSSHSAGVSVQALP